METKFISALGHELQINDWVQFKTTGFQIIGKVDAFGKDKVVVRTVGCRYKSPEEFAMIQKKAKQSYKVKPNRCFKMVPVESKNEEN